MSVEEIVPYVPAGMEREVVRAASDEHVPVMLTGPTGCGKTRLVEHMAEALGRTLVTITCHDDLSTADLVGRHLVQGGDVRWFDGPLTRAVREGAICYLDEIIEARRDTLAVLHSLCDHRRTLYLERTGEALEAPTEFMLIASYNPRARGAFKELKPSFRQRFVTVGLDYLPPRSEAEVVSMEAGVPLELSVQLVAHASAIRQAADKQLAEAPSTRVLITTARLIKRGLDPAEAVRVALIAPLSSTPAVDDALNELLQAASGSPNGTLAPIGGSG